MLPATNVYKLRNRWLGHESHSLLSQSWDLRTLSECHSRMPRRSVARGRAAHFVGTNDRPVNLVKITVPCLHRFASRKEQFTAHRTAAQLGGFPLDGANTCCCPCYFSTMVWDYDPWSQLGLECCPLHDAVYRVISNDTRFVRNTREKLKFVALFLPNRLSRGKKNSPELSSYL